MKIAVTLNVLKLPERSETRDSLDQAWYKIFKELKVTPVLIPNNLELAKVLLAEVHCDALVLTGGNNISSSGHGDAPEREEVELFLVRQFESTHRPVMGICRGMQILHQYYGGRLTRIEGHARVTHEIQATSGIVLPTEVNSYHDFGIELANLPSELRPLATVRDSDKEWVEAFEGKKHKVKGIMWHPERGHELCPLTLKFISDHLRGV